MDIMANPLQAVPTAQVMRAAHPPVFAGESAPPNRAAVDVKALLLTRLDRAWFDLRNRLTPLSRATFTVIDTETTGLDPHTSELIEVTAIQYRNGQETRRFSTLVKPGGPIPERIRELTGITDEMVADAPSLETAMRNLVGFVGRNPLIVGHYANFDINQLCHKLDDAGLSRYKRRFSLEKAICTKTLGQVVLPELKLNQISGSLIALGQHLGIVNDNPHRAESDVRTTAGVLFALAERSRQNGFPLKTLHDLFTEQGPPITEYAGQPARTQKDRA